MKTPKEAHEAKVRMANQAKLMLELVEHEGFKMLKMRLDELALTAKEAIIASTDFQDLIQKRSYFEGLNALDREITTIISRGKKADS